MPCKHLSDDGTCMMLRDPGLKHECECPFEFDDEYRDPENACESYEEKE